MKHGSLVAAAGAAAIVMCLAASPAKAQLYGDIRSGLAEMQTIRFAQRNSANLAIDPHAAWVLSGTLGTYLSGPFRIEGVATYQRGSIGGAFNENVPSAGSCGTVPGLPCLDRDVRGSLKMPSVFAMGHYDIRLARSLGLSLGAGVGAIWMDLDAHTTARSGNGAASQFSVINGTDTVVAGRAVANLVYGSGPFRFLLGYSYTHSSHVSLQGQGINTNFNFNPRLDSHQISANVRFRF